MTEFAHQNLSGARFEDMTLTTARFHDVDLTDAQFRLVDMSGVVIRNAVLENAQVNGEIRGMKVNGVEVFPLVEAELDRRYPERVLMRPTDAEGFRVAWGILQELWAKTVDRARHLPDETLQEQVDGEWSFVETLRHLVFATDAWVRRALLGDPSPWDPLDLPPEELSHITTIPQALGIRPSLEEVLVLRADRMETVSHVLTDLTDERLAGASEAVLDPSFPESVSFPVRRCLQAVVSEEWAHRLYAERDLDILAERS